MNHLCGNLLLRGNWYKKGQGEQHDIIEPANMCKIHHMNAFITLSVANDIAGGRFRRH